MKAPCKDKCKKDMICMNAENCPAWRDFVRNMKQLREEESK